MSRTLPRVAFFDGPDFTAVTVPTLWDGTLEVPERTDYNQTDSVVG